MTRYSHFIWAPDIKAIPPDEAQTMIDVQSTEELWWKRLVYERETEKGREIIIHLVRIPPTPKVDYEWADEPAPLTDTTITINRNRDSGAILQTALACRPYHYEEAQQVVETKLTAQVNNQQLSVKVPPFRYHTMVVLRFENEN